ncbi:aldose 1-epimerase [Gordonia sp. OPL2]|uniref:aldose epimerase family protein n=1 Tax=Gordonia sp. OPL2 TaxID=2486274 RepID=UPI001655F051|nr:aldose 1-epimerase [Gordonia sp. OPL2]RPA10312.1 aldose 1-epimerase [Gordonia sp. OPL2]
MTLDAATSDVVISSSDAAARVSAQGGRLTSLTVRGHEVLQQGAPYGCFPMVPWCGRMRDGILGFRGGRHEFEQNDPPHALHGTARDHLWEIDADDDSSVRLRHGLRPWWPFDGVVTQTLAITPGELVMSLRVSSDTETFPAQAGWHPWFRRRLTTTPESALRVDFRPRWQEERGVDYLPTGRRITPQESPLDDCFGMPHGVDVALEWPDLLHLRIRSDARWVVVFDHRPFATCVEPQTGPPNGINTAPDLVGPGEDLLVTTTWTW